MDFLRELKSASYLVAGREVGASGTRHLQGFVQFKNPRTHSGVCKLFKGAHIEVSRNVPASIEYCKKENDVAVEFGTPPLTNKEVCEVARAALAAKNKEMLTLGLNTQVSQGIISVFSVPTLKKARMILAEDLQPYDHCSTRGIYVFGPPRTGKSCFLSQLFPNAFYKSQNKWWDGYTGQKEVILDDMDSPCLGHKLKIWLDRKACVGEVKCGHVQLQHHVFAISSNYGIDELFKGDVIMRTMGEAILSRCKVIQFIDKGKYIVKRERDEDVMPVFEDVTGFF